MRKKKPTLFMNFIKISVRYPYDIRTISVRYPAYFTISVRYPCDIRAFFFEFSMKLYDIRAISVRYPAFKVLYTRGVYNLGYRSYTCKSNKSCYAGYVAKLAKSTKSLECV